MHKVIETSERLIDEALRGLSKGYNQLDLDVLGKAVDILKDAETIEAMKGNYQVELKDGKVYSEKRMMISNIRKLMITSLEWISISKNIASIKKNIKRREKKFIEKNAFMN